MHEEEHALHREKDASPGDNSKEYVYNRKVYAVHVVLTNALMALTCVVCIFLAFYYPASWGIFAAGAVVSLYAAWNAFVSVSNPGKILISDQAIVFCAFGREHRYERDKITYFNIRQVGGNEKMFLRINKPTPLRGRYWVDVFSFNDSAEMAQVFLDLERKIHPDSLKEVARSGKPLVKQKKK